MDDWSEQKKVSLLCFVYVSLTVSILHYFSLQIVKGDVACVVMADVVYWCVISISVVNNNNNN